MIGGLNHIAIAVKDIADASARYREALGAKVSAPTALPDHGVTVAFVELPNTTIELIEPLGDHSPIAKFLASHPGGAIHHLCFEVEDIFAARERLTQAGARVLGDGTPQDRSARQACPILKPQGFRWDAD